MPSVESKSSGSESSAAASRTASKFSCNSSYTRSIWRYDNYSSVSASAGSSDSSVISAQSLDLDVRFAHQSPRPGASQTLDLLLVGAQLEQSHDDDPHFLFADLAMLESALGFETGTAQKDPHVRYPPGGA